MNEGLIFWLGFSVGALAGVVALVFVVEFARWLVRRKHRL